MAVTKKMLKAVRDTYSEDKGIDLILTDDVITALIEKTEGFDDMDGDAQIEVFAKAAEKYKTIAISDPTISGLVKAMDTQFHAELGACIEAVVKGKQSAVDMLGQFKRIWTLEQFKACPYPGAIKAEVEGTNWSPDITERKAVAGGMIRVVWTDDLAYAMSEGKAYQDTIDECSKELKISGTVARFKNKGKQYIRDELATATQGRNALRQIVRRAIQSHHKLDAISMFPLVKWSWIPGTHEKCSLMPVEYKGAEVIKITRSPKPLWLEAKDEKGNVVPGSGKEYSISQVIAFDTVKARAEGGTVGDLVDSAKAPAETPESLGEKMTDETMDTNVVVTFAKLSNTEARAALRTRSLEKGNEEMRAAYCGLHLFLASFYKANNNATWYEEYQEKQNAKDTAERDAKKANAA